MLAATFAMTVARLNQWRINFKPHAATQTTPSNGSFHSTGLVMVARGNNGAVTRDKTLFRARLRIRAKTLAHNLHWNLDHYSSEE